MIKIKCVLLGAGYATRLYPLTLNQPKPLLDVKGKPIAEYLIRKIEETEVVDEIFIVTNNKFYNQFQEWSKNFNSKIPIKILNDKTLSNEDRLGAIGDINFAIKAENIQEDLVIISGDNLFKFDLKDMHDLFKNQEQHLIALYDVKTDQEAKKFGTKVEITDVVERSTIDADVVATDTWVSMGDEADKEKRIREFQGYTIDNDLMSLAKSDAIFMHCLPAFHDLKTEVGSKIHKQFGLKEMEVTDEVFRSKHSKVFDEAENRLHTIKAVMVATIGDI